MDLLFNALNLVVLPFWLLMIAAPRWRWTRRICGSLWIVVPPAIAYVALVIPTLPQLAATLTDPGLEAVAQALSDPRGATLAWAHFVTFDLFVGRWVYLDSRQRDFSPWWVGPTLLATLMTGPLGLAAYLLGRRAAGRER